MVVKRGKIRCKKLEPDKCRTKEHKEELVYELAEDETNRSGRRAVSGNTVDTFKIKLIFIHGQGGCVVMAGVNRQKVVCKQLWMSG